MADPRNIRDTPDEINLEPWAIGMHPNDVAFVREFTIDLNAMQALIRCGHPEVSAKANCSRQLRRPVIARAIAAAMAERAEALGITAKTVLGEAFRSYLAAAADRNWAAAARFLEMVGRHVDVRAFRDRVGLLDGDHDDEAEAEGLKNLDLEDLEALARIQRKLKGGSPALPAPSALRH